MLDIEKNYSEFIDLLKSVDHPGVDKLIYWLDGSDMKVAPSSTKYHLSIPGGLVQHSLNVYNRLKKMIEAEGLTDRYSNDTLIIVSLCHDLCKVNYYELVSKSVKARDEHNQIIKLPNGKYKWLDVSGYDIREDKMVYGLHGENSVYILTKLMAASYEEQLAIRWHMGCLDWQDAQSHVGTMSAAFAKSPLAMLLHFADAMASTLDEDNDGMKDN